MKTESKLERYCKQIMGALDNDCPGCLFEWIRQLTLREAQLGATILCWKLDEESNTMHVLYGNPRTGEVSMWDNLADPSDIEC